MVINVSKVLQTVDSFGNITAMSFQIQTIPDPGLGSPEFFSYVLQPSEFAADISAIIKREVDKAVIATNLITTPPTTLDYAPSYTVVVDNKGASTVTKTLAPPVPAAAVLG